MTPLLLVLVAAVGYLTPLFGRHIAILVEEKIVRAAGHVLAPTAVHKLLEPVLTDVLRHGRGGIISLGLLALWTGSTAMSTYVNTITIAYGMREVRSAVKARLLAFGLYLGALAGGVITLPLLVTAPGWITAAAPRPALPVLRLVLTYGYWPVVALLCTGLLAALYHLAVPVRGRWRRDLPGAIGAMLAWLASSFLLRAYLVFAIGHSPTYSALSAPVAALLFPLPHRPRGSAWRRIQRPDRRPRPQPQDPKKRHSHPSPRPAVIKRRRLNQCARRRAR